MAHGPVNKAWFIRLSEHTTFKVNETAYNDVKDTHPDAIVSVLIGARTDKCVHLWDGAKALLESEGYEHKNGRIYGKRTEEDEFSE